MAMMSTGHFDLGDRPNHIMRPIHCKKRCVSRKRYWLLVCLLLFHTSTTRQSNAFSFSTVATTTAATKTLLQRKPILFQQNSADCFIHLNGHRQNRSRLSRMASRITNDASNPSDQQQQQAQHQYLATCLPGLSSVLRDELRAMDGLEDVQLSGTAAVTFSSCDIRPVLYALLWVRTAHKLLQCIGTTAASQQQLQTRDDLYDCVQDMVNVKQMLGDGKGGLLTLSVHVTLIQPHLLPKDLCHSHYSALTIKNAIVDAVRDMRGDRPNVDTELPQVPLVAMLKGNHHSDGSSSLSLYKSLHPPGSLHRRGYRKSAAMHKAAMKESMAAGLLLEAGYGSATTSSNCILVDPMAGSGSLVLEAAMIAADLAPGLMRIKCGIPGHQRPPVLDWKVADENQNNNSDKAVKKIWRDLLIEATQRAKQGLKILQQNPSPRILANDIHEGALDILESSLQQAGLASCVQVYEKDCRDWELPLVSQDADRYLIVTNPPWGARLSEDMHESWESLRVFLRSCPPNTESWVLSGNKESTRHLGLKRSRSMSLHTAQQNLRWIQYKILEKPPVREERPDERSEETHDYTTSIPRERPAGASQARIKTRPRQSDMPRERGVNHSRGRPLQRPPPEVRNDDQRVDPRNKSVIRRLSRVEREERKDSWLI